VHLGLLQPVGGGDYHLTGAGRAAVRRLPEVARAAMAPLSPLPEADLQRLAGLLDRLVETILAAPESPGKWCLRIARHFDPGVKAPAMVRLDQYLSDLYAYRDDAHLAAWRHHGVSGQEWEAFTYLWQGRARTLDELCEKLAHRGFTREDYAIALKDLVERKWVAQDGGIYSVTARGDILRHEAEDATNRTFYAAWGCLSESEIAELRGLLTQFRDALKPPQG
jgi:hypothetical protein